MGSLRLAAIALLLGTPVLISPVLVSPALAQSAPTYGLGRATSAEEIRARDINVGHTGEELPPGHGTPKEGAKVFELQGCIVCHGAEAVGGVGPRLNSKTSQDLPIWKRERILPLRSPFATTVWDYIRRGMPLGREGTLTPDEVYALTAYLLFLNKIIPEDAVLDEKSLPNVKMPIGDHYARLPEWKPGTPRLQGYPY
ncbi:c-type cytochrome [Rhodoplanes sp. Z2-YC6860]|uniref:c-type cytochrome n=1 Tax=Rhodoplanes sp. Z2-YC6860 TaxID=674703 RepID=UPI00078D3850|nr:cytochrome c [Rhodoplanes sp. Z2-YC6860]AMN39166.1 cytochrome C, class I [Rhodoplanes sp. Z2-YC6860]